MEAVESLYRPDIVSTEAAEMGGMPRTVRGLAKVKEKGEWWVKNHEVHGETVEGPYSPRRGQVRRAFQF